MNPSKAKAAGEAEEPDEEVEEDEAEHRPATQGAVDSAASITSQASRIAQPTDPAAMSVAETITGSSGQTAEVNPKVNPQEEEELETTEAPETKEGEKLGTSR